MIINAKVMSMTPGKKRKDIRNEVTILEVVTTEIPAGFEWLGKEIQVQIKKKDYRVNVTEVKEEFEEVKECKET